jgi:hypothetical protein
MQKQTEGLVYKFHSNRSYKSDKVKQFNKTAGEKR